MTHVDYPREPLPIIGACAGYGGLELGVGRCVPVRAIALVEREAYAAANLVAAMEAGALAPAPVHTDVRSFPWELYRGRVAGFLAGYPCQPESAAGKRQGKADERWLWPYLRHGVEVVRPAWCFFENVAGHVARGLGDVMQDLGGMGYRTTAGIFAAAEVGAPHLRKRIFIFAADPNGAWKHQLRGVGGEERRRTAYRAGEATAHPHCIGRGKGAEVLPSRQSLAVDVPAAVAADLESEGLPEWSWGFRRPGSDACDGFTRGLWWTTEPGLLRGDDAGPHRVDRLRLLGNGVVPAQAALAFRHLVGELMEQA
jgi:DNA (cytosine-5)-methyltransferase 1